MATGKNGLAFLIMTSGLIVSLLLAFYSPNHVAAAAEAKSNPMLASEQIGRAPVSIPPIDLEAPVEFATATFGLG